MVDSQAKGTTLHVVHALIAATALYYNLSAVTRNVRDFTIAGLNAINPWQA